MSLSTVVVIKMPEPNKKTKKFLEKHPAMSKKEIKEAEEKDKKVRQEREHASIDYEKNLLKYFEKTEPIIDPDDGITIALMRYPSYDELMDLVPPELEDKYADYMFKIISELVVQPKKDADWWRKQKGVMRFVGVFNVKLAELMRKQSEQAVGFPTPSEG